MGFVFAMDLIVVSFAFECDGNRSVSGFRSRSSHDSKEKTDQRPLWHNPAFASIHQLQQ